MSLSLSDRIVEFLKRKDGKFISKGEICDIAREYAGATGEYTGRELRKLTCSNDSKYNPHILVIYKKNHAHYSYKTLNNIFDEL